MKELLDLAFSPIHFPLTLLLLVVLLYWLTVIVGLLDFSFLNVDVDADVHVHTDFHISKEIHVSKEVQMHKNVHVDVRPQLPWLIALLLFFNVGKVPFTIFLSFLTLFCWSGSILSNYYLGNESVWMALILFIPNIAISLFLTKFLTTPLIRVFSDGENEFETNRDVIGKPCTILISVDDRKVGQAEVKSLSGAPLLLTVKTTEGRQLKRGEKGLVIDYDTLSHTYLVEPFDA